MLEIFLKWSPNPAYPQTYANNVPGAGINDADDAVFARRSNETTVSVPWNGKNSFMMHRDDIDSAGRLCVPHYYLKT